MKKLLILILIIASILTLVACTGNDDSVELPKGKCKNIYVNYGDSTRQLGAGYFEYINETTVKFDPDTAYETNYYIPASSIIYITY